MYKRKIRPGINIKNIASFGGKPKKDRYQEINIKTKGPVANESGSDSFGINECNTAYVLN